MNGTRLVVDPPPQRDFVDSPAGDPRLGEILCIEAARLAPSQTQIPAIHVTQQSERLKQFLALRQEAALRCRETVCIQSIDRPENLNGAKLVATQPSPHNCKHELLKGFCATCNHSTDGLVDARGTAKRYITKKQLKMDDPHGTASCGNVTADACDLPRPEPRHHQVTPEDVDWAERQSAFHHSQSMPRKAANYCADLKMYVQENWNPRDGESSSNYENIDAAYRVTATRSWEEDLTFQREHRKVYDRNSFETRFLNNNGTVHIDSFQAWVEAGHPPVVEGVLKRDGRMLNQNRNIEARAKLWEEAPAALRCSLNTARRAKDLFTANQPWMKRPRTINVCPHCEKRFAGPVNQKFCSDNCNKRHFDRMKAAKENTCQQQPL